MGLVKRAFSSLLLASGIVLVFTGLSTALGLTLTGLMASISAIAALLYAGGLWFGGAAPRLASAGSEAVIVFDRFLKVTAGAAPGTSLVLQFPEPLRAEIELHCRLALRGEHTHFDCEHAGSRISFDIAPISTVSGVVPYGVLITGAGRPMPVATAAPLTTIA
jgi:hypothetical protein